MSELTHFITLEYFETNTLAKTEFTIRVLLKYKLLDLAEKKIKTTKKNLTTANEKYADKLKARIWMNDHESTLNIRKSRTKHENATDFFFEQENNKAVMDFALVKCYLNLINQHRASISLGKEINHKSAQHYFHIYESGLCSDDLYVRAYYLLAKLQLENKKDCYNELKEIILEDKILLENIDKENLMVEILSFVNNEVEMGNEKWYTELFDLYDHRLRNKLWQMNGDLAYTSLFNTVFYALMLNKLNYAAEIIETYSDHIAKPVRNDIKNLCLAWVAFYRNELDKAHNLLLPLETENIMIKFELRTLQCMIYFENKEYLILLSYLDSFKHFITYNKHLMYALADGNQKLCNYLSQLCKIKLDPDKNSNKLMLEISEDHLVLKEWLLKHVYVQIRSGIREQRIRIMEIILSVFIRY